MEVLRGQADLAQQIYDTRTETHMTCEQLAEFAGLTAGTIEDLQESDYDGDWVEAIDKVSPGFHHWFTNVVLPSERMKPEK